MKTIEFNKDSWHFKLAAMSDSDYRNGWRDDTDICSYTRSVLGGLFLFSISCAIIGGVVTWSLASLFALIMFFLNGTEVPQYAAMFFCLCGGLFTMFLLAGGTAIAKEKLDSTKPGFVRTAYRSWKDKFCARITFVDNNGTQNT